MAFFLFLKVMEHIFFYSLSDFLKEKELFKQLFSLFFSQCFILSVVLHCLASFYKQQCLWLPLNVTFLTNWFQGITQNYTQNLSHSRNKILTQFLLRHSNFSLSLQHKYLTFSKMFVKLCVRVSVKLVQLKPLSI